MCYMNKNTGKKLMVTMMAAAMALGTGTTSFAAAVTQMQKCRKVETGTK